MMWLDEMASWQDATLLDHLNVEKDGYSNLKEIAAKYLPEPEWTPTPEPKLREMSREDRAFLKSMYWGFL